MESDLSVPGAREERAKLKQFHALLNRADIVPEQSYRMSTSMFPLMCFVNNMIGLYVSKNYEVIPIFISRAYRHMAEQPARPAWLAYYALLQLYLRQMAHVLRTCSAISEESLCAFIPQEILDAGPQEVPCFDDKNSVT